MSSSAELYNQYTATLQRVADIKYAAAVLQWDQETYLPPKGAAIRGRQLATLSELAHQQFTDDKLGALLQELSSRDDLGDAEKINVALTLEDYTKNKKLPGTFVRQLSEAVNTSFHAWLQARKDNRFAVFEQPLATLVALKQQEAQYLGFEAHPYNALMNDYEKGATVAVTDALFAALRPQLSHLLDTISKRPQVDDSLLHQHYPKAAQWEFGLELLRRIGYDFDAGRQDLSEHPFTTSFCNGDVRITTRVAENNLSSMTWSCLHEGGHGLYEQGLPADQYGLPLGEYCSLGIHESQSRLWENCAGRSMAFWTHNFSLAKTFFPEQLGNTEVMQFFKAINKVQPSLIRTEADELTYHFHVMIRYELEKRLIEGSLAVADIPAYWNEQYRNYLGIAVPDDRQGCLQDVHWSHGSFGYFATYSLGSLYAAQLYAAVCRDMVSLETDIAQGNTAGLLQWLRRHIHQYGRRSTSAALCKQATGSYLDTAYFIDYATKKYNLVYS